MTADEWLYIALMARDYFCHFCPIYYCCYCLTQNGHFSYYL